MIFLGGIFPFLPLLITYSNGMFIGIMAAYIGANQQITTEAFIISLLPHGVFEIPAFVLASAVGWSGEPGTGLSGWISGNPLVSCKI